MEFDRQLINTNIDIFIRNKGIPKLYFGEERIVYIPSMRYAGYVSKVPYKTLRGASQIRGLTEHLMAHATYSADYFSFRDMQEHPRNSFWYRLNFYFTKKKWGKRVPPDFNHFIEHMQEKEKDKEHNISNQPQLSNALSFRYTLLLLSRFERAGILRYLGTLQELKADLEIIPRDIQNLPLRQLLSNLPRGVAI
jgi:hypothetical protein